MGLLEQAKAKWQGLLDYIDANTPRHAGALPTVGRVVDQGLINPNRFNKPSADRFKESTFGLLGIVPGVGDYASVVESADLFNRGEKFAGGMAALGALPLVPAIGGMFIGKGAKTWDVLKAQQAEELLKQGIDPREVWKQTGTMKGVDGFLRQEIPDNAAELAPALKSLKAGGYGAQPIKSIDYLKRPDGTFDMTLVPPNPKTTDDFLNFYGLNNEILDAMVPEYHRARMLRGQADEATFMGDFEDASRLNMPFEFGGFNALPANAALNHAPMNAAYPSLMNDTLVQVDPKLGIGGHFAQMDSGEDVVRLGNGQQKSTALHELQHAIQQREGWARGGSPDKLAMELQAEADLMRNKAKSLFDLSSANDPLDPGRIVKPGARKKGLELERQAQKLSSEANRINEFAGLDHDAYRRLAGEAEARLTQARMGMNMDERLASYPYDMLKELEGLTQDQLIVRGLLSQ